MQERRVCRSSSSRLVDFKSRKTVGGRKTLLKERKMEQENHGKGKVADRAAETSRSR